MNNHLPSYRGMSHVAFDACNLHFRRKMQLGRMIDVVHGRALLKVKPTFSVLLRWLPDAAPELAQWCRPCLAGTLLQV